MAEEKKEQLVDIENLEINALDDKELESVAGGADGNVIQNTAFSCQLCNAASGGTDS